MDDNYEIARQLLSNLRFTYLNEREQFFYIWNLEYPYRDTNNMFDRQLLRRRAEICLEMFNSTEDWEIAFAWGIGFKRKDDLLQYKLSV